MSEEQLKAFKSAVEADEGLQEQLKTVTDVFAVVAIAKAAGFVITAEELVRAQGEFSEDFMSTWCYEVVYVSDAPGAVTPPVF